MRVISPLADVLLLYALSILNIYHNLVESDCHTRILIVFEAVSSAISCSFIRVSSVVLLCHAFWGLECLRSLHISFVDDLVAFHLLLERLPVLPLSVKSC